MTKFQMDYLNHIRLALILEVANMLDDQLSSKFWDDMGGDSDDQLGSLEKNVEKVENDIIKRILRNKPYFIDVITEKSMRESMAIYKGLYFMGRVKEYIQSNKKTIQVAIDYNLCEDMFKKIVAGENTFDSIRKFTVYCDILLQSISHYRLSTFYYNDITGFIMNYCDYSVNVDFNFYFDKYLRHRLESMLTDYPLYLSADQAKRIIDSYQPKPMLNMDEFFHKFFDDIAQHILSKIELGSSYSLCKSLYNNTTREKFNERIMSDLKIIVESSRTFIIMDFNHEFYKQCCSFDHDLALTLHYVLGAAHQDSIIKH